MDLPIVAGIIALATQAIIVVGTVALLAAPAIAYLIMWFTQRDESGHARPTPPLRNQSYRTIPGGSGMTGS
jgi:hypothetical protein